MSLTRMQNLQLRGALVDAFMTGLGDGSVTPFLDLLDSFTDDQEAGDAVTDGWVTVRGCGSHHYTPDNINAIVRDLKAVESGTEFPPWLDRDYRTRCGILWRVISALMHDVPMQSEGR